MKKFLVGIGLFLMFSSLASAQESFGDKVHEAAHDTAEGTKKVAHAIGDGVKTGAHQVAKVAKKAKNHVADGFRHGKHALQRSRSDHDSSRANK
jgi:hypothetical protein